MRKIFIATLIILSIFSVTYIGADMVDISNWRQVSDGHFEPVQGASERYRSTISLNARDKLNNLRIGEFNASGLEELAYDDPESKEVFWTETKNSVLGPQKQLEVSTDLVQKVTEYTSKKNTLVDMGDVKDLNINIDSENNMYIADVDFSQFQLQSTSDGSVNIVYTDTGIWNVKPSGDVSKLSSDSYLNKDYQMVKDHASSLETKDGLMKFLTWTSNVNLSSSGTHVAFTSNRSNTKIFPNEIWFIEVKSGKEIQLTDTDEAFYHVEGWYDDKTMLISIFAEGSEGVFSLLGIDGTLQ